MIALGDRANKFRQERGGRLGFTLVELLGLCLVLLVVSFLLLPSLVRAKQKTTQASCQSNLKQIGLALQVYTDANREFLPGPAAGLVNSGYDISSSNQLAWYLAERLGAPRPSQKINVLPVLLCPAEHFSVVRNSETVGENDYMLNQGRVPGQTLPGPPFGQPTSPVRPPLKLSAIADSTSPANCFAMADADKGNVYATLPGWSNLPYRPVHGKFRNQLFFDGHVAAKRW